ncbi:MAG TPA: hypothetical protein VMJ65_24890 [Solirubrobacteraceae bacterium]|nr:hypothetical protein [Solirubrobacteraceae bacterium]
MHTPILYILINQAHTEDLHRAAQKFGQRRLAALTSRNVPRRRGHRAASVLPAIQHLNGPATGKPAAAASEQR